MDSPIDFTLDLPSIDYDLVADWLCDSGPELPLTAEDVRQLYSQPSSPEALKKHASFSPSVPSSIHPSLSSSIPPTPPPQSRPVSLTISAHESLWDDSDSDDTESVYSQPEVGTHVHLTDLSDDDCQSDASTLHHVPIPTTSLSPLAAAAAAPTTTTTTSTTTPSASTESAPQPPSVPPPAPAVFRNLEKLLRFSVYSLTDDPAFWGLLDGLEERLLRSPVVAWADACYLACVRPDPLTGAHGILAHSSDLDRVSEQDEEVYEAERRTWIEVQEQQTQEATAEVGEGISKRQEEEVDSSEESEEEEEDEEAELVSPVQTYVTTPSQWGGGTAGIGWFEKPFQGRDPVELLSSISLPSAALIPPTKLEDSSTCNSPAETMPPHSHHHHHHHHHSSQQLTYLFLKAPHPHRDSFPIGGFPTRTDSNTSDSDERRRRGAARRRKGSTSVKHLIMRGLNLGWRDRVQIES